MPKARNAKCNATTKGSRGKNKRATVSEANDTVAVKQEELSDAQQLQHLQVDVPSFTKFRVTEYNRYKCSILPVFETHHGNVIEPSVDLNFPLSLFSNSADTPPLSLNASSPPPSELLLSTPEIDNIGLEFSNELYHHFYGINSRNEFAGDFSSILEGEDPPAVSTEELKRVDTHYSHKEIQPMPGAGPLEELHWAPQPAEETCSKSPTLHKKPTMPPKTEISRACDSIRQSYSRPLSLKAIHVEPSKALRKTPPRPMKTVIIKDLVKEEPIEPSLLANKGRSRKGAPKFTRYKLEDTEYRTKSHQISTSTAQLNTCSRFFYGWNSTRRNFKRLSRKDASKTTRTVKGSHPQGTLVCGGVDDEGNLHICALCYVPDEVINLVDQKSEEAPAPTDCISPAQTPSVEVSLVMPKDLLSVPSKHILSLPQVDRFVKLVPSVAMELSAIPFLASMQGISS